MPILYKYATECESIIECGVRRCVSSWAFTYGLLNNNKVNKNFVLNDITYCNIDELLIDTKEFDINIKFIECSNLILEVDRNYDLVFIDTWHVYGQLKRELNKFNKITNKYIIMHDTTIDEIFSESIRNKHDINKKMEEFNFTRDEVILGLGKAIDEFLVENPNWKMKEKYINNNGLTVLEKI